MFQNCSQRNKNGSIAMVAGGGKRTNRMTNSFPKGTKIGVPASDNIQNECYILSKTDKNQSKSD